MLEYDTAIRHTRR